MPSIYPPVGTKEGDAVGALVGLAVGNAEWEGMREGRKAERF